MLSAANSPIHELLSSQRLSIPETLSRVSHYLAQAQLKPYLQPDAQISVRGVESSNRGRNSVSQVVLGNLRRIEAGLRGEILTGDPLIRLDEGEGDLHLGGDDKVAQLNEESVHPTGASEWQSKDSFEREQEEQVGDYENERASDRIDGVEPMNPAIQMLQEDRLQQMQKEDSASATYFKEQRRAQKRALKESRKELKTEKGALIQDDLPAPVAPVADQSSLRKAQKTNYESTPTRPSALANREELDPVSLQQKTQLHSPVQTRQIINGELQPLSEQERKARKEAKKRRKSAYTVQGQQA